MPTVYNHKEFNNAVVAYERLLYCKIGYFGGKQMKYIVSEHFTDAFNMTILIMLIGNIIQTGLVKNIF